MPKESLPHFFIKEPSEVTSYTSPKAGGGDIKIPTRNRKQHGNFLKKKLEKLWEQSKQENQNRKAIALSVKTGHYIEFRGQEGFELITKSLENIKNGIRLLNIHHKTTKESKKGQKNKTIIIATVYIPDKQMPLFIKKIEEYLNKETNSGKPKNQKLIESIEDIRLAILESFWQDDKKLIPKDNELAHCEIWLRTDQGIENKSQDKETDKKLEQKNTPAEEFFKICDQINKNKQTSINNRKDENDLIQTQIEYEKDQIIFFPERLVVLIKANKKHLIELIKSSDHIAEIRRAKETAQFFLDQSNKDQTQWVEDLQQRLVVDKKLQVSVCLLDTGVNNGHLLIKPVLSDKDCHTVDPKWGTHDDEGHGTKMSGLVIYGDLQKALESPRPIHIRHRLESVKLIPKSGRHNKKELYGHRTKQGISRAEIENPDQKRVICMAVTSTDDRGKPSSWSGAIDQISSGAEEQNKKRLLIISAGNVKDPEEWKNYPESNLTNTVHDPAQSWNALTVGAYTDKVIIKNPKLKGYKPLANKGELSPFSSTSLTWDTKKWPIKPDIVLEGGNVAKDKDNFSSELEDLSLLSLHHKPQENQFEMINATSSATAQAGWMASQIQVRYPKIWPETIRALLVHSAEWKESMKNQFWDDKKGKKKNYHNTLRAFGYGVPNLDKALFSYKNSLTLVSEQIIQPFTKKDGKYSTNDMHFYKMPWPKYALKSLSDKTKIQMRFTLSYFIEPGPGEIGWKDRYRYSSYGLRFSLIKAQEKEGDFKKRINKAKRDEDKILDSEPDNRWLFGANNRDSGSIHSDIWEGTALDIAECNLMAVYTTIGWWKERYHINKWNKKARYSLIVSLSSQEQEIDLWTPVKTQIEALVKV